MMGVDDICGLYITWGWRLEICELHSSVGRGVVGCSKSGLKSGKFYGMELPRVGAFTEKWGSGYRNPVQISGEIGKIT